MTAATLAEAVPASAEQFEFAPEWVDPRSVLFHDLRRLSIRGELPLTLWTTRASTRMDLARARNQSTAGGASPSASRLDRELAGELTRLGRSTGWREVRPLAQWALDPGTLRLRPYAALRGDWLEARSARWGDGPRVGIVATAHLSSRFSLQEDLFAGRVPGGRRFADALIAHTDLILSAESMTAGYESGPLSARIGRFRNEFGPGRHGGLLFSADAAPLDQIQYGLRWRRLRFIALAAQPSVEPERNLAFHRLEWFPNGRVLLGLSEGAAYPGSPFQPLYLSGLIPYTLIERLHGQDTATARDVAQVRNNVLWQLDVLVRPQKASVAYASLLLDDIATESSDMPSRLGYQVGWESTWLGAAGEWSLGGEALKIFRYTYSVFSDAGCACDWIHQGRALGSLEGPDVERLELFGSWSPDTRLVLELSALHRAHGEGRLGVPWYPADQPQSAQNPAGSASQLSGTVERRDRLALELRAVPSAALSSRLWIAIERVENRNNVRSRGRRVLSASLGISAHR